MKLVCDLSFTARPLRPRTAQTPFSPAQLFAAGEPGIWLDPSDLSTLFQDAAGTQPVTAPGQPVGCVLDKSGQGHHAVQPAAGARPVWRIDAEGRPHLDFDGNDDFLTSPLTGLGRSDIAAAFAAGYWRAALSTGYVANASGGAANGNDRSFNLLLANTGNAAEVRVGGAGGNNDSTLNGATHGCVAAAWNRMTGTGSIAWNGGAAAAMSLGPLSQTEPLNIGRRVGGAFLHGRIYGLVARLAPTGAGELGALSQWIAQKTGVV